MLLESIFVLEFMKEQSQQKSQDIKVADFSLQMYFMLVCFFFFPNNSFQITSFVHEMSLGAPVRYSHPWKAPRVFPIPQL